MRKLMRSVRVSSVLLLLLLTACASNSRPLQLLNGQGPIYPPDAKAAGLEGKVVIRYDVNVEGRVVNARVFEAVPPGIFDEAALNAVTSWRFNAPIVNGQVRSALNRESTVAFRLDGGDAYSRY
jgi:TonB family protein